jgi:hypothetical protein
MSAVLRAAGRDFDVDAFVAGSTLKPCRVYRRGERRLASMPPSEESGLNIPVSVTEFVEFPKQVAEATEFLQTQAEEIRRLTTFPGVEGVTLDFGIERRDVVVQCDLLPADLIRIAGSLGLSIELSQYPPPDGEDEQTPHES